MEALAKAFLISSGSILCILMLVPFVWLGFKAIQIGFREAREEDSADCGAPEGDFSAVLREREEMAP